MKGPTTMPTRSQVAAGKINAALRARNAFIWIRTPEEARVERYLIEACAAASYIPRFWDCGIGVQDINGTPLPIGSIDITATLGAIRDRALDQGSRERCVWIMRDLAPWLAGAGAQLTVRPLRNLVRLLPTVPRDRAQAIIVISAAGDIPPELAGNAVVLDWPNPDRDEIAEILDNLAKAYSLDLNGARDAAIDAAVGLTGDEASACYASSLVTSKRVDPVIVAQEKKAIIAKSGSLQWMEPLKNGFDSVGGLDVIKTWMLARTMAYSPEARAYGLPVPKGIVLVGVSGCGKTLIAKAIAWALGRIPLLRWDINAGKSKFLGESEANLRRDIRTIESCGRVVVLVDEMEKVLAGASGPSADGGTSADQLSTLLTWMQERENSEAFVVATCNDVSQLPPEILRKGRWDELFWVDLPTHRERIEVLQAALRAHGREFNDETDWNGLAIATDKFTGAEIASLVPDAMFAAFADSKRDVDANDIVRAARTVYPLSETAKEKIDAMRKWSIGRARPATTPDAQKTVAAGDRQLDM
jgi:ATP-dependent 26S proteasome regulatory subunit